MGEKTELKAGECPACWIDQPPERCGSAHCPKKNSRTLDRELLAVQIAKLENWATEMARSADAMHEIGLHEAARGNKQLSEDLRGAVRTIMTLNTRAHPTPQDQGSLADGWRPDRGALVERICIGLFSDFDSISIECAEMNWRNGFAYGAVGSDAHREIMETANKVADSIFASPSVHAEKE